MPKPWKKVKTEQDLEVILLNIKSQSVRTQKDLVCLFTLFLYPVLAEIFIKSVVFKSKSPLSVTPSSVDFMSSVSSYHLEIFLLNFPPSLTVTLSDLLEETCTEQTINSRAECYVKKCECFILAIIYGGRKTDTKNNHNKE